MSIERTAERDAAIMAMLPVIPELGWTEAALQAGLVEAGGQRDDAALLFRGGTFDMIEAYIDLADREMADATRAEGFGDLRLTGRVRAILAMRFRQARDHRDAVRRAFGRQMAPDGLVSATRTAARTVDAVWHLAGDRSADVSWYTKRAILAGVYGSTLLFWLADPSPEETETLAFLDRRLAGVGRFGRALGRLRRRQ